MMKKTLDDFVLLTGSTGLLGRYLMRDLLEQGRHLAVVVRANRNLSATERVEQTMQMWERQLGRSLPRAICLEGDINQPGLGLDEAASAWVRNHVGSMMHAAASLEFRKMGEEPWRTNVEGTRNVLQFCKDTQIPNLHYVSTAYVCGKRDAVVYEDELDVGQEFRNVYEESKFTAEKAVREAEFEQTTIYRPVVITGDSQTGYTSTYHGTYLYMKLAKLIADMVEPGPDGKRNVNINWGLTGNERRNITHVDWNSAVICKLFATPESHGRTFHLAPSQPITMREAIEYANEFYHIVGIDFGGYGLHPEQPLNEFESWLWENISVYRSYDFMDPQFDCTNLKQFAPTPPCPKLDGESVKKLIEFAEVDRWGKRKLPAPKPATIDVESFFERRRQDANLVLDETQPWKLRLEVLGPGGGPWWVEGSESGIVSFGPGVPRDDANIPLLRVTNAALAQLDELTTEEAEKKWEQLWEQQALTAANKQLAINALSCMGQFEPR